MKLARIPTLTVSAALVLLTSCAVLRRDGGEFENEFEVDDPDAPEIVVPEAAAEPAGAAPLPVPVAAAGEQVEVAEMRVRVGGRTRTVTFRLFPEDAPRTVANFRTLANDGFYRGLTFHRAISGFLVQTGDPLTRDDAQRNEWGTGGPGYTIPAEIDRPHVRGSVAMARLRDAVNPRRESNGSQFYFALTELPELDDRYTVFGEVIGGIEVLDEISRAVVDTNEAPVERFEIRSLEIRQLSAQQASAAGDEVRRSDPGARGGAGATPGDRGPFTRFLNRFW